MMARMEFADRIVEAQRRKDSIAVLGVDPHLDTRQAPGIPAGYSLMRFCCEVVEASADFVIAIKPQLAFFEARGIEGMRALVEILALARRLELLTIADAKRGDIGSTSAAYAEAFLGHGDFACDAVTVNPYLGSDAMLPSSRARVTGVACSCWSRLRMLHRGNSRISLRLSARSGRLLPSGYADGATTLSARAG